MAHIHRFISVAHAAPSAQLGVLQRKLHQRILAHAFLRRCRPHNFAAAHAHLRGLLHILRLPLRPRLLLRRRQHPFPTLRRQGRLNAFVGQRQLLQHPLQQALNHAAVGPGVFAMQRQMAARQIVAVAQRLIHPAAAVKRGRTQFRIRIQTRFVLQADVEQIFAQIGQQLSIVRHLRQFRQHRRRLLAAEQSRCGNGIQIVRFIGHNRRQGRLKRGRRIRPTVFIQNGQTVITTAPENTGMAQRGRCFGKFITVATRLRHPQRALQHPPLPHTHFMPLRRLRHGNAPVQIIGVHRRSRSQPARCSFNAVQTALMLDRKTHVRHQRQHPAASQIALQPGINQPARILFFFSKIQQTLLQQRAFLRHKLRRQRLRVFKSGIIKQRAHPLQVTFGGFRQRRHGQQRGRHDYVPCFNSKIMTNLSLGLYAI